MWWSPFFISTVTKSSLGSINWATVLISSHSAVWETMWPIKTHSKHKSLTRCYSKSGPPSATLAQHQTNSGSMSRVCWVRVWQCILLPAWTPTQCLLNVGPASLVLASIHLVLGSTSCWRYRHAGSTGMVLLPNAGLMLALRLVTLAHIQCGAKHDTVTQYWANVGSAS